MNIDRAKIVLTLFLIASFVSVGSAAKWNLNPVDEPFSLNKTGVNTSTVQLVEITYEDPEDNDKPAVTPTNLKEGDLQNLNYYYNKSNGTATQLKYLEDAYWYANFQPNLTSGDIIKYNASGTVNHSVDHDVSSGDTVNLTEDLNVGDLKLTVMQDFSEGDSINMGESFTAGETINLEAEARNVTNGNLVNGSKGNGNLLVSFTQLGTTSTSTNLDNYRNGYFYNSQVQIPSETNETYLMHVEATNSTGPRAHGTWSKIVHTYPAIHGKITRFSSDSGCKDSSNVSNCEAGADISIGYNITAASAQGVNLTAYAFNNSGRHELMNMSMNQDSTNYFTADMEIPDLNTSKYMDKVEVKFEAYNDDRNHVDRKNITIDSFTAARSGSLTTYTGESYSLQLAFRKPYSLSTLNKSRFDEIEVNITNSNENLVESYNMSDLNYNSATGLMERSLLIKSNASTGRYDIDVSATNIYNKTKTFNFRFRVKDINATFDISDETFDVETLWDQNFTVNITNEVSQQNYLEITNNLPSEITLNNNSISLSGNEEDLLHFTVNLTDLKDASGEITLEDNSTGYNNTIEVTADAVNCEVKSGRLCSQTSDWINVTIDDSSNSRIETADLVNLGPVGDRMQFNASVTGDITNYLSIVGENINLNITGRKSIDLNYTATEPGNFTGKIEFITENGGALKINTSLEADINKSSGGGKSSGGSQGSGQDSSGSISLSSNTIDLGTFPAGESSTQKVEVINNLNSEITNLSVSSNTFLVSASGVEDIPAGENLQFTLQFEQVESSSGQVTISGGGSEATLDVTADPVDNYKEKAENDLRQRLRELERKVSDDSELSEDLTGVSTKIGKIKTAWEKGNYGVARSLYREADATLARVSNEVNSEKSGGENSGNDSSSGGGIPILPIGIVIMLLLVIGFVFYTSYVPEEGDPLYDIMGE